MEQPRPSPERALPPAHPLTRVRACRPPSGHRGKGSPYLRLSSPRDWILLPGPHSTAQRGRGRRSQAPAAFCSAWDGRDLAALLGESEWASRAWGRPLPGDPRSSVGRLRRSASRARWERQAIPRGVRANRFLFAT